MHLGQEDGLMKIGLFLSGPRPQRMAQKMIQLFLFNLVPTYLLSCLPTFLRTYLHTYLPTYLPTCLPTYLPTYLLTYLPNYLPTYTQEEYVYSSYLTAKAAYGSTMKVTGSIYYPAWYIR